MNARPAAFLDRDGVVNLDAGYVHRWSDFRFADGAVDAMRRLRNSGRALVIVTNQSGIARGLYTEDDYAALTAAMTADLAARGAAVDAVLHCPHLPGAAVARYAIDCDCRKPQPGLILRAAQDLGLSLPDSLLVGDKPSDIAAARAAGVGRAYLVGRPLPANDCGADGVYLDLAGCVDAILG